MFCICKIIFYNFFSISKESQTNITKNTRKDSDKQHVKDIKIFLKNNSRKYLNI